jgi:hypothetical protein
MDDGLEMASDKNAMAAPASGTPPPGLQALGAATNQYGPFMKKHGATAIGTDFPIAVRGARGGPALNVQGDRRTTRHAHRFRERGSTRARYVHERRSHARSLAPSHHHVRWAARRPTARAGALAEQGKFQQQIIDFGPETTTRRR